MEYFAAYYLSSVLAGNKYKNLIVIGAGEAVCGAFSGYMLSKLKDTTVWMIACALNGTFIFLFYFVPSGMPQYICLFLTVSGIAMKCNAVYVLAELRIPPENAGGAMVIILTVGIMAGALSPYLSLAGYPISMILIVSIALLNFLLCLLLDKPGAYLPSS